MTDGKINPRATAARILSEIIRRDAYAEPLLDSHLARADADQRDRGFCTALVYGVLRMGYRLDRFIEAAAKREVGKIHPKLLVHLRLGAFQLLHMDRVPPSAAVDTTVRNVKNDGLAHAAGFANAVLRRIAEKSALPEAEDEPSRIALQWSVEPWLVRHWIEREGLEGAKILARQSAMEPPLYLRLDTRLISRNEAVRALSEAREAGEGRYAPESVWVRGGSDPRNLPPVAQKFAVIQGQASQLIAPLLSPEPGMRVLDACAAPGMKTLHLARLMEDRGEIVALDLHPHRVRKIEEAARHYGFKCIKPVAADAATYDGGLFDAVLADVPCTGLGVLSKNPERKGRLSPDDPARMAELQGRILENMADRVRPGGVLVYSTCTTPAEENENVVEKFLSGHPEFSVEKPSPDEGLTGTGGYLRTFPRDDGGDPANHLDGFFAARLRRR